MSEVKRVPVTYRWDGLNWEFLKTLAEIAHYAGEKYGSPEQYTNGRLEGEKSPINHIYEHLRMYTAREPHDHFGGLKHQLAAIAYNAMMEAYYLEHGGATVTDVFAPKVHEEEMKEREPKDGVIVKSQIAVGSIEDCTRTKPHDGPCNGWLTPNCIPHPQEVTVNPSGGGGLLGLFRRN